METMYLVVIPPWLPGISNMIPDPGLFETEEEAMIMASRIHVQAAVIPVRVGYIDVETKRGA